MVVFWHFGSTISTSELAKEKGRGQAVDMGWAPDGGPNPPIRLRAYKTSSASNVKSDRDRDLAKTMLLGPPGPMAWFIGKRRAEREGRPELARKIPTRPPPNSS
mmetsp:Transcript_130/g.162  ORF Transcript_130/g.162 Transcript_130/m.162 type:complete len:104 (+) Transcript_130:117-428(+)|eukprot:CAMPEP_0195001126 /NCGR_PEP_ID=MMETSP0326_2-20130528/1018_1 /TAXON_ID=2866 ORGANISM="Crypthecodinium cohnii, Strain Seligo" /NCGR_SAMPLE_ID=MMETSP0326_2 /ASSEMBLY_ACC=CAM_ASM_000348 /LENGTH=103 /DNA_ID=CAMNT_0040003299 /DNA_START=117 /DNA_END=428 /DNA_ORIENTATION=+